MHPYIHFIFIGPDWLLLVDRLLNLTQHLIHAYLFIEHLLEQVFVLRVKDHVGRAFICFLIKGTYYLPQPDVPDDEEEPIADDQFALALEHWFVRNFRWDAGHGPTVRPVLLQISQQVCSAHPLDEVLKVIENLCVQPDL